MFNACRPVFQSENYPNSKSRLVQHTLIVGTFSPKPTPWRIENVDVKHTNKARNATRLH